LDDLESLIEDPRETLEIELKDWLDLGSKSHRAKLAKELIALANHGGGHLVLGFDDTSCTPIPRPDGYTGSTDDVNGIVARFADPAFHCEVREAKGHPVVIVPGGHKVPIRTKRSGPNNEISQNVYYIRRPGPNSEPPQTGLEWDELLQRCQDNRDAELEAMVGRVIRAMNLQPFPSAPDPLKKIKDLL